MLGKLLNWLPDGFMTGRFVFEAHAVGEIEQSDLSLNYQLSLK
jgi:hypothetical protein